MKRFAQALQDPETHPEGLSLPGKNTADRRFSVYRNNVAVALSDALAQNFPTVTALVGAEFMTAMGHEFVRHSPPKTPVLAEWGEGFATWLAQFPPVSQLPYLPDIAQLDHAARRALNARDARPLDPSILGTWDEAQLSLWRPALHPAVQIVESAWPLLSIRAQALGHANPDASHVGSFLVHRPGLDLRISAIPEACRRVMLNLRAGHTLGEALADEDEGSDTLRQLLVQAVFEEVQNDSNV